MNAITTLAGSYHQRPTSDTFQLAITAHTTVNPLTHPHYGASLYLRHSIWNMIHQGQPIHPPPAITPGTYPTLTNDHPTHLTRISFHKTPYHVSSPALVGLHHQHSTETHTLPTPNNLTTAYPHTLNTWGIKYHGPITCLADSHLQRTHMQHINNNPASTRPNTQHHTPTQTTAQPPKYRLH